MGIQEMREGILGEELPMEFNMKISASDGIKCTVSEAEEKDLKRLIETSCMHCNRVLARDEVKVVPPQMIQEQDRYVSSGEVARRVMCTGCYERMASSTRERVRSQYRRAGDSIRRRLFKAFASGTAGRY